ncbi:MAG: hypothetical protein Fur0032_13300 [Terrimicrobiaceae bacterium]
MVVAAIAAGTVVVHAGDILRGGANNSNAQRNAAARANSGADAAAIARRTAQDRLARTTRVVEALRQGSSSSAASAAAASVPGGLVPGGLVVAGGANARWDGAALPQQNGSSVNIVQNAAQAVLHWESFNVGRGTVLNFDQSAGGADASKWIAFNRVVGASAAPSRILGSIKAQGQVYVINQNGVIFGRGSQVNARTLVASALPINDNLLTQGLLNNRDAQFLFSALEVPGGGDGTPAFVPPAPPASGRYGDVIVEPGALLKTVSSSDGNGGRIMLVGANVRNEGVISTPSGQAILAAGLQVGVQAHRQDDPSLRGLDVWVGDVGTYAGRVVNSGLIESRTGNIILVGRNIEQLGALDSSTSVNLNGRIDLQASYGAVGNPNFDRFAGSTQPPFVNQFTGTVKFGSDSVVRVLPDLLSTVKIPGTSLAQVSQINVVGQAIHADRGSILMAPGGDITMRAGIWPFKDTDNNRTTLDANGNDQQGLSQQFTGVGQRFLLSGGQIYLDSGSLVDASGTTDAFIPLDQHILTVQMRGSELADSPLLRDSNLRAVNLVVDLRRSGLYGGREWVGTPLGDLTGIAGIIERDISQLTARGGRITLEAGGSIVVASGATVDVSGGIFTNAGGRVQTSRLLRNNRHLIDIDDATPDVLYDYVYEGKSRQISQKWGVDKLYAHALAPLGGYNQREYVEGASAGTIELRAPSMLLEGDLRGRTVKGPRQLESPPGQGTLKLRFSGEKEVSLGTTAFVFLDHSPTPPRVEFAPVMGGGSVPSFQLVGDAPVDIPGSSKNLFTVGMNLFAEDGGGFGNLEIENPDGDLSVGSGFRVLLPPGGSLVASAKNVDVSGSIVIPGGRVALTAYNFSPFLYEELSATGALANQPAPGIVAGRGVIRVAPGATIDVAGAIVDDRPTAPAADFETRIVDAGSISLEGYSVLVEAGSLLDASGGIWATPGGDFVYGDGGDISVLAGRDPDLSTSVGGRLVLDGILQAYSAETGGSLTVQANFIQVGGSNSRADTFVAGPEFFRIGGFTEYNLIGLGGRDASGAFLPAVRVVGGTVIEPVAERWIHSPFADFGPTVERFARELEKSRGPAYAAAFRASLRAKLAGVTSRDELTGVALAAGKQFGLRTIGNDILYPVLQETSLRSPASISLEGLGFDDAFSEDRVEGMGIVLMEAGSAIRMDPGATVRLEGDYVEVLGEITAPAGTIEIAGRSSFRLPPDLSSLASFALPTVRIGSTARLSAAGTTVMLPDPFGRRHGIVYPGGSILVRGNILADAGAVLDVSGTSAVLDFHPTRLALDSLVVVPRNAGLNSTPWGRRSVPVQVDSDGGLIDLEGSQFLYVDATLLGRAGGPSALGGTLAVSSGRFYAAGSSRTGADTNLIVRQSGNAAAFGGGANLSAAISRFLASNTPENVLTAAYLAGNSQAGIGFFAVDSFTGGGFDNLDLGFKYYADASPIPYGGNVEFQGPVNISARGFLRLAGGGVIRANGPVSLSARYIAVGQEFRAPLNPDDPFIPFREFQAGTGSTPQYFLSPTDGAGSLTFSAPLIDIGTLVTQGVGSTLFAADGGDIRGNGILSVMGDLTLRAAQIYPTTLATFDIFAYDPAGGLGSVNIVASGSRPLPLSAGGRLRIFASEIVQGGTLRAPLGSISLGWDGTDVDPSTAALDVPFNAAVGSAATVPTTQTLTLLSNSVTSVSAIDPSTGKSLVFPYGLSPDGLNWIDPRGVNITVSGLPTRGVTLLGESVTTMPGSVIDLRGGGDLLAYRWIPGIGGSVDILGSPSSPWSIGRQYEAGDLVEFGGETWSARVTIDPADFTIVPEPEESRFWTRVSQSYAILPSFQGLFAPFNPFNTGPNSGSLAGDPGYVSSGLRLGGQVTLRNSPVLAGGTYTLLPRRYGVMPGAYLIIPLDGELVGSATPQVSDGASAGLGFAARDEGSYYVAGYATNSLQPARVTPQLFQRFEVLPPAVLLGRAQYDLYYGNDFLSAAAKRLDLPEVQRLPRDSAFLAIHGNSALSLAGSVLAQSAAGGRGSNIDVSSFAEITIVGGTATPPGGAGIVLSSELLSSWGGESLLVGGLRRQSGSTTVVDVRTSSVTLDNPGTALRAPDVVLASTGLLSIREGSSIRSSGRLSPGGSSNLSVTGDGALVRVSGNIVEPVARTGTAGGTAPLLEIGPGVILDGASVMLDSTYASEVDPTLKIRADFLTVSSGQISVVFEPQALPLPGSIINPHFILSGELLESASASSRLRLASYGTLDVYGSGTLGDSELETLEIRSSGLRAFNAGAGVRLLAGDVLLSNPSGAAAAADPGAAAGVLTIDSDTLTLGKGTFRVAGFDGITANALERVLAADSGSLETAADLAFNTSLITGGLGVEYNITTTGDLNLVDPGTGPGSVEGGLGATLRMTGASVNAGTTISLPSGSLVMTATTGDLTVSGRLAATGSSRQFYDLVKYADGGRIELVSRAGSVIATAGSEVTVSADPEGGDAGELVIRSPLGVFDTDGVFEANAGTGGLGGSFILDSGTVADFSDLGNRLDIGGFTESRKIRIRAGNVILDGSARARHFGLAVDGGSILVLGEVDASGLTGGSISMSARDDLTLAPGSRLSVAGAQFSNSGQGGSIFLEAGASINGASNPAALLTIAAGSEVDLSVAEFVAGDYLTPGSSAFLGRFEGTLHLRAPRVGNGVGVGPIDGSVVGGSAIIVEPYRIYQPAGGIMNISLRNTIHVDNQAFMVAGEAGIRSSVLGAFNTGLDSILVVTPGVEIINPTGDLTLGLANPTGSASSEALASADWDLSGFRYGARNAPGMLTLRAAGNLVFNNTLSDGFHPIAQGSAQNFADIGHSQMWLAPIMTVNSLLPTNVQAWSYRLTAGADVSGAGAGAVLPIEQLAADKGSVLVGEFYPDVPNPSTSGSAAAIGQNGQTADSIRISTNNTNRGTRYEVVRTGAGFIDVVAGRDVQLRNTFATIYTAGVGVADVTRIFQAGDFSLPQVVRSSLQHPSQGGTLGAIQQNYAPSYAMAGGDVRIQAGQNIGRYTMSNGVMVADSSRQIPTNWLYRRGQVDPATGLFAVGGVTSTGLGTVTDPSASVTWWVDHSNFFQGFGALGGGDIHLLAGKDIVNADAAVPTTARMAGIDPLSGLNIAPDESLLQELGGGDLVVDAGRNIDGGSFYVERGTAKLDAGRDITTNEARSPSRGRMGLSGSSPEIYDSLTWQAVTLFGGRAQFDVTARGSVLLGPTTSAFLLPQGLNNKFWYKTQFITPIETAGVDVTALGGSVTHRLAVTLPGDTIAIPTLAAAYRQTSALSPGSAGFFRPWLRLAESRVENFNTAATVGLPSLRSTSFAGDITVIGKLNLMPSPAGELELAAAGAVLGLGQSGITSTTVDGVPITVTAWTSASLNLSDANPSLVPGLLNPVGFQQVVGSRDASAVRDSIADPMIRLTPLFQETGSFSGVNASADVKSSLHAQTPVHKSNPNPVRIFAGTGDITGLTLFSAKKVLAHAGRDITDVAFYLQHVSPEDISIVSAGRDIIPFNENAPLRSLAGNTQLGNLIVDAGVGTVVNDASGVPIVTKALAGDIQVGGEGVLEVLAGRNLDLGTGANFIDGTGVGITSIGRSRNPFLPFAGADIVVMAGVTGASGGAAQGLAGSSLQLEGFAADADSGLVKGGTDEHLALAGLKGFFAALRKAGEEAAETGSYDTGYEAIAEVFGMQSGTGELFTRARDIRTVSGGGITVAVPGGGLTMASDIFGNPLTPPGIVTEFGGEVSIFTDGDVDIGQARIFTLRGGDLTIWSSSGDIAAGNAPKTVVTAPPTRVLIDSTSGDIQTDLGGLATGGGIGVLASVEGVEEGNVVLLAPRGTVDAGDAGIRSTGDITIAAAAVVNADNISAGGTSTGVPAAPTVAAPNIGGLTSAASTAGASSATAEDLASQARPTPTPADERPSDIQVQVLGYGGGGGSEEEDEEELPVGEG